MSEKETCSDMEAHEGRESSDIQSGGALKKQVVEEHTHASESHNEKNIALEGIQATNKDTSEEEIRGDTVTKHSSKLSQEMKIVEELGQESPKEEGVRKDSVGIVEEGSQNSEEKDNGNCNSQGRTAQKSDEMNNGQNDAQSSSEKGEEIDNKDDTAQEIIQKNEEMGNEDDAIQKGTEFERKEIVATETGQMGNNELISAETHTKDGDQKEEEGSVSNSAAETSVSKDAMNNNKTRASPQLKLFKAATKAIAWVGSVPRRFSHIGKPHSLTKPKSLTAVIKHDDNELVLRRVGYEKELVVNFDGINTVTGLFDMLGKEYGHRHCHGTRVILKEHTVEQGEGKDPLTKLTLSHFHWESYNTIMKKVQAYIAFMASQGVTSDVSVAIWANTCSDWFCMYLAFMYMKVRISTVYSSLSDENIEFALNQTNVRLVVVDKISLERIFRLIPKLPNIQSIYIMNDCTEQILKNVFPPNMTPPKVVPLKRVFRKPDKFDPANPKIPLKYVDSLKNEPLCELVFDDNHSPSEKKVDQLPTAAIPTTDAEKSETPEPDQPKNETEAQTKVSSENQLEEAERKVLLQTQPKVAATSSDLKTASNSADDDTVTKEAIVTGNESTAITTSKKSVDYGQSEKNDEADTSTCVKEKVENNPSLETHDTPESQTKEDRMLEAKMHDSDFYQDVGNEKTEDNNKTEEESGNAIISDNDFNHPNTQQQQLIKFCHLSQLLVDGSKLMQNKNYSFVRPEIDGDTVALVMFTSGSTGTPKGVMLQHKNIMAAIGGVMSNGSDFVDAIYSSFLPLAHIFELVSINGMSSAGGAIGFCRPLTLTDQSPMVAPGTKGDWSLLRPTHLAIVPALLSRMQFRILKNVAEKGEVPASIFDYCIKHTKKQKMSCSAPAVTAKAVLGKVSKIMGGRARFMICGGAPLSSEIHEFSSIAFGLPIMQGYGLTETSAAGTLSVFGDMTYNHCGIPLSCTEIRLAPWHEGGYLPSDHPYPRGEVHIGGNAVSLGYYNNQQLTDECYYEDETTKVRYFRTGDIACFNTDTGTIQIIDRKKDIIKLIHGEYVSLVKVEIAAMKSQFIESVCALPNSRSTHIILLVVPRVEAIKNDSQIKAMEGTADANLEQLLDQRDIVKIITNDVLSNYQNGFNKFEIPKRVHFVTDVWSPDNGLLTPSMKVRKVQMAKFYKHILDESA